MTRVGVRNLAGLNKKVREAIERGEPMEDPLQSAPLFAAVGELRSDPAWTQVPDTVREKIEQILDNIFEQRL